MQYNNSYGNNRGGYSGGGRGNNGGYNNNNRNYGGAEKKPAQALNITRENYVDIAEDVIMNKIDKDRNDKPKLTTSKIRNILSMVTSIYDDVSHTKGAELDQESAEMVQYLRLRIAYEAGRDTVVKDFVEQSDLLGQVKKIGKDKAAYQLFCKYVEALVAYHRYYGGKD